MQSHLARRARAALAVYIACFAIGWFNHARDFVSRGWRPYAGAPPLLEAFWTTLIGLDALAIALLLFGRRRLALSVAAIIMIVDVLANTYAWSLFGVPPFGFALSLPLQSIFLGFVLGSAPFLWSRQPAAGLGEQSGGGPR